MQSPVIFVTCLVESGSAFSLSSSIGVFCRNFLSPALDNISGGTRLLIVVSEVFHLLCSEHQPGSRTRKKHTQRDSLSVSPTATFGRPPLLFGFQNKILCARRKTLSFAETSLTTVSSRMSNSVCSVVDRTNSVVDILVRCICVLASASYLYLFGVHS